MAPEVGLEPTTLRLTAECSAIELLRSVRGAHLREVRCALIVIANTGTPVKKNSWTPQSQSLPSRTMRKIYTGIINRKRLWLEQFATLISESPTKCHPERSGRRQR